MKLTVENVHKEFETPAGPLVVLKDVSLEISPGQTLAVVGPSGSGKSTLLNIIGSLEPPTAGSVKLGEIEVSTLKGDGLAEYRARRVGFVFQDHHLLSQCSALENVILPTLAAGDAEGSVERATELLKRVGLEARMHAMPAHLSGGERQRVAIARALVNRPPVLLCDEPTGNLDADTAELVTGLFIELAREQQVSLIMVTHNLELARQLERICQLRDGVLQTVKD